MRYPCSEEDLPLPFEAVGECVEVTGYEGEVRNWYNTRKRRAFDLAAALRTDPILTIEVSLSDGSTANVDIPGGAREWELNFLPNTCYSTHLIIYLI